MELVKLSCKPTCQCSSPMEQLAACHPRKCIKCGMPETPLTHIYNQSKILGNYFQQYKVDFEHLLLDGNKNN